MSKGNINYIKELKDWTFILVVAIGLSFILQHYVIAQVLVQQHSMENSFFEGQRLIEFKLSYSFNSPSKGDVVIINEQSENKRLIKRVIGLPGDIIDIKNGFVYINGVKQVEAYVKGHTYQKALEFPIKVSAGKIFVLGDNREVSMDSRELGLIDMKQVEGKIVLRIWPLPEMSFIK